MQTPSGPDPCQGGERGIEVQEFDDPLCRSPWRDARTGNDQGDPRRPFEQCLLHPLPVLPQVIAMIADKDDDRVVGQVKPIECVQEPADIRIQKTDGRVVRPDALALRLLADAPVWRTGKPRRRGRPRFHRRSGRRDAVQRIQVEVLARGDIGTVRPVESSADEERPVHVLFEQRNSLARNLAVCVCLIAGWRRIVSERAAKLPGRCVIRDLSLFVLVDAPGIHELVPRRGIVQPARANLPGVAVVVDLADAGNEVAAPSEHLRHRDDIRQHSPEVGLEVVDASRVRP